MSALSRTIRVDAASQSPEELPELPQPGMECAEKVKIKGDEMKPVIRICEECGKEFIQTFASEEYEMNGEMHPAQVHKLCKDCVAKIPDPFRDLLNDMFKP